MRVLQPPQFLYLSVSFYQDKKLKSVLILLPVFVVIGAAVLLLAALEMDTLVAGELATLKDPVSLL